MGVYGCWETMSHTHIPSLRLGSSWALLSGHWCFSPTRPNRCQICGCHSHRCLSFRPQLGWVLQFVLLCVDMVYNAFSLSSNLYCPYWNSSGFGMSQNVGHLDFFPNGGKSMPECKSRLATETVDLEEKGKSESIQGDRSSWGKFLLRFAKVTRGLSL